MILIEKCEKCWNLPDGYKEYKGIDLLLDILMDLGIELCLVYDTISMVYPKVATGVDRKNLACWASKLAENDLAIPRNIIVSQVVDETYTRFDVHLYTRSEPSVFQLPLPIFDILIATKSCMPSNMHEYALSIHHCRSMPWLPSRCISLYSLVMLTWHTWQCLFAGIYLIGRLACQGPFFSFFSHRHPRNS